MTSLRFFKASEPVPRVPVEWGTGKPQDKTTDLSVPRNATWRQSGEPTTQYYKLTQLKLSNVRDNDELIPRPQAIDIGKDCIDLPFPAEHPYTSHVSRYALFPKFDSPQDPKRGVAARNEQPISSEMPANPCEVIVKEKIKGFPRRHEFADSPQASNTKALYWPGEDFFDQQDKTHGPREQFYPTPPKLICPNLQDRSPQAKQARGGGTTEDLRVSERTANALRNVERDQWLSSYQQNYTGLGPSNPMVLDNLEEKREKEVLTGVEDDSLHPRTVNTFDPARSFEGRLARSIIPVPLHHASLDSGTVYNTEYNRKATLTEREEHRLLYGTEYINLPDTSSDPDRDVTWRELDQTARAGACLDRVGEAKIRHETGAPPVDPHTFLPSAKIDMHHRVQEMEAQNRWRVLESETPQQDQRFLKHKMTSLPSKDQPPTFYRHEGRYNEERAGLYKTSYDPHLLNLSLKPETETASDLVNTLHSNTQAQMDVSLSAARLNEDVNAALKWSRTFNLGKPELSGDRRDGPEVIQTYNQVKSGQRDRLLPPSPDQACPRVQEKELIQQEATTTGSSYNTTKFLQHRTLPRRARIEPLTLMSCENQSLCNVRSVPRPPTRNVHFSQSVTVAPAYPDNTPNSRVQTQLLENEELTDPLPAPPLSAEEPNPAPACPVVSCLPDVPDTNPDPRLRHSAPATPNTRTRHVQFEDDENNNAPRDVIGESAPTQFRSFAVRYPGSAHGHGLIDSEYTDSFRGYMTASDTTPLKTEFPKLDLGYKQDKRFEWQPGSGLPRKQSSLMKLQDSFSKTEVRRQFHNTFPEINPPLTNNITKGRRHQFWGFNSQVIHG